jgi:hypothetical protein
MGGDRTGLQFGALSMPHIRLIAPAAHTQWIAISQGLIVHVQFRKPVEPFRLLTVANKRISIRNG